MLVKLTNIKKLDSKMKRHILGGASCSSQCENDCSPEDRVTLDGDSTGKEINTAPATF